MIYLVVALHPEAKPLIEHFELKRDTSLPKISLYTHDHIHLIVSGFGSIRSAIATTSVLSQSRVPPNSVIFNVGIAGCRNESTPLGSAFLINKIIDHDLGKHFYPDILFKHD